TRLCRKLTVVVVEPVPRERARTGELERRRAVGVDRERERGPHGRALELHERRMRDSSRRGNPRPSTGGLNEARRLRTPFGVGPQIRKSGRLEREVAAPELDECRGDEAASVLADRDDLAAFDVEQRAQPASEPNRARGM